MVRLRAVRNVLERLGGFVITVVASWRRPVVGVQFLFLLTRLQTGGGVGKEEIQKCNF